MTSALGLHCLGMALLLATWITSKKFKGTGRDRILAAAIFGALVLPAFGRVWGWW